MIIQDMQESAQTGVCAIQVPAAQEIASLEEDVRRHLLTAPHSLPPKYFYDHRGSMLFDQICDTPEYYPTRTESRLLSRYCQHIVNQLKLDHIIELGSGTSRKTRHLLDACQVLNKQPTYWPFDVCEPMIVQTAHELMLQYEWLDVQPLEGDYSAGFDHLPKPDGHTLYVFLGSSIGNFTEPQAIAFLQGLKNHMLPGDTLLLGVDRVKDNNVLEAAYNDEQGITAEFNLNVLSVLNRELGANFRLHQFDHQALFNEEKSQIEMYLHSTSDQQVRFNKIDEIMYLHEGDKILTEISRKYSLPGIERLMNRAGLKMQNHFEPANEYFSLVLATCA